MNGSSSSKRICDSIMEETQRNLRRRGTLLDLPRDIIQDILLLLSVKSLLRLKCVSKSLCSLISSESFVKAHLLKSHLKIVTNHVCERLPRVVPWFLRRSFTLDDALVAMGRCTSTRLLTEALTNSIDFFRGSLERRKRESTSVRSCNGLVCVFSISGKDFTLWNPSTRKYKKLPPVDFEKGIDGSATSCGFGYVESSDDYKVFALSLQRKIDDVYHCTAKVYSLKTGCWKVVDDDYKLETPMDLTARYVCGMLYWLRMFRNKKNGLSWEIISFDLEKEVYGTTVEQPGESKGLWCSPQLGVFHGSLCVLCISRRTISAMDIWALKQDTPLPSWTKMAVLPDTSNIWMANQFGVCTDGVIFRICESDITPFYYLPNDMCKRSLRIVDLDIFNSVCVHVESLVSLGNSEEAGVYGGIIDLEIENRSLEDYDDDDQSDLEME